MRSKQGFTLLEVLVALAIFAVAALGIMKAVSQHLNTLGYLEEKTFAAMVADNELAQLHLSGQYPTSSKTGKSTLADREWYWTVKSIKTQQKLLRQIEISVASDPQREHSVITVKTYVVN
ncbi:type II secretion system protein GspI [Photobacterium angustum]|uniref:Type II secretion system protein I n=2 Tax=Photobacterium angustum TaxID=661 RepID=A0A855SAM3_PHOAN|nr:type II secretion system minor pseudopilin GspI [Photobacterium angustum]KJF80269.1 general secretion pathway protein GspI [Photobacterium damselae subsp. damselae]EAS62977.1 putative type II secretory pathway, pseudopilin EpsI [Vibrio angustum S14] [Photobacterium angustum S14]KJG00802.1 general secretion pathway protein GspI [Photobacterium angustum]KJG16098.1 general secretion pathway protein GspI [Photobacterium angustum]KJG21893.1 general secretion pathway protein GspI [Photobacterium 